MIDTLRESAEAASKWLVANVYFGHKPEALEIVKRIDAALRALDEIGASPTISDETLFEAAGKEDTSSR